MKFIFRTLKKTLFWSYDRGSWQYDLMCVLILAFIFFAPNRFFSTHEATAKNDSTTHAIYVAGDELGSMPAGPIDQTIERYLEKRYGHKISISRIDRLTDESGKVVYLVHEK